MNIRPYLIINNNDSRNVLGLLISELAPISKPLQRTMVEEIDGRDGDIITPLGFSAYDKVVKIALTYDYNIDDIISFFNSEGKVVFSNEPDKYYKFAIYQQIDFERLIRFKTADVVFHVQPFKFSEAEAERVYPLSSGDNSLIVRNNGNIYSRPTIGIYGSGDVMLSINGNEILQIAFGNTPRAITIDAEQMNAYGEDNTLLNRLVIGNYDNIKLNIGSNEIGITGNVSYFMIRNYSRWI